MNERPASILVVDDNETNRDLLCRLLTRFGFRIITAEDGPTALKEIASGAVDLVLLDIMLPGMSGLNVLKIIRKSFTPLQLPVIMLTARTDSKDVVESLGRGANDYVTKPIDVAVTVARINTHLSLKRTNEALRISEQRYALAARGANDGLWDWDLENDQAYFSPRWKSMLGYQDDEIGSSIEEWFSRTHREDVGLLQERIKEHTEGRSEYFEIEHRISHKDGSYRWVVCRGVAVRNAGNRAVRMAGSQRDVTSDRVSDPLTGLPNRTLFMDRLGCLMERTKRQDAYVFGVLSLQISSSKIAESLGYEMRDQLFVSMARRLESCLRGADTLASCNGPHTLARTGGDVFSILLDDIKSHDNAVRITERLLDSLALPFNLQNRDFYVIPSIGLALSNTRYARPSELLDDAEVAMNQAGASEKACYEVFKQGMRDQALSHFQLENELRRAIDRGEFEIFYQTIVSAETFAISGFETLVRWKHPRRGLLHPSEFIPLAEQTGLIDEIDYLALRSGCEQLRNWQERYPEAASWVLSVNLSAKHFTSGDLVNRVFQVLARTGLNPASLKLEVTESEIMHNLDEARALLEKLRSLEVQLALDDFGTGYSSLSYLQSLPINTLKIDRSFVASMTTNPESQTIISSIISLAHNLDLNVIAEGVETSEQLNRLRMLECDYVQGYLFGKPMPATDTEALFPKSGKRAEDGSVSACPSFERPEEALLGFARSS